jgi:RND family efflux transporter MFP subunit
VEDSQNRQSETRNAPHQDLSSLKIDKSGGIARGRTKKRRYYWLVLIVLAVAAFAMLYVTGALAPSVPVQISRIAEIFPSQSFTVLNASGYVVAQRKSALASKVTGRLIWLGVEEGSKVKAGDIIARLESQDVLAGRDQARANLNTARWNVDQAKAELDDAALALRRAKDLIAKGYIAQADYDTATARYNKAEAAVRASEANVRASEAALKGAEVSLEYTLVRAPFDAVVLTKNADVGDIVTPMGAAANAKASVVTVADMGSLKVEADVSESNLELVKMGQPCEIQLDALPDSRFRGKVHMIVPTADRSKATVLVKVGFVDIDPRVLPEMSAKVAFLSREPTTGERKARTAVNRSAVVNRYGRNEVFKVKDGKAVETPITVGEQLGDMVEVRSGGRAGDQVVLNPTPRLKDGMKVKVSQ